MHDKGGCVRGNRRFPGFYINLTKKLVVPLKNRKKKWAQFLKLDIFKNVHFSKSDY